jgi:hypothetical protein
MDGDDVEFDEEQDFKESKFQVLPAYEHVKLNTIFHWFKVQSELQQYILVRSLNKINRPEKITSLLLSLYLSMLKDMMIKRKKTELIEKLDKYCSDNFCIPEDKLIATITEMATFLYEIGYLNTLYEKKPWQQEVREGYGIF